ncbi:threonine synthase [Parapedobacter indicus]|uniref:Threonine synthase n=1 Tax=Parapedobacter indicus TaxID=1477437 RepID=A0A1I3MX81_9SPHI|nr:threonine synthase [Parapedobacter indicus]PPL00808.1 threonine synthase [Parapedobacter indicus]SFJ01613.1 threonine synthase [Parapedobacter indicus]
MQFYSTNNKNLRVPFQEAVFNSLPTDKGLYMPETVPTLDPYFIQHLHRHSLQEIALTVAKALIGEDIPEADLRQIVHEAIDFDAPVRPLDSGLAVLELFHGPSLAFKDFGARFMSRVMAYFSTEDSRVLDVLVATSGDTGGAVALGFLGVPGTRVTILYPKGKVSPIQELQLTTNGQNIRAIEIDGTFDDCQALVKEAFNDNELRSVFRLTSANSINIARLIPQTFYYFHAYAQLLTQGIKEVVFSVPSGNFGNIGAGLLAFKMGLPAQHFVAATNANDTVTRFLENGQYEPRPSVQTLANAMDVGNPSNWVRIMDLFGNDLAALKQIVSSFTFTDADTRAAIQALHDRYGYIACPHTAIAWLAAEAYRKQHSGNFATVFLSTAHPCKFPEVFPSEIAVEIAIPSQVTMLQGREKEVVGLRTDYKGFKNYLLSTL